MSTAGYSSEKDAGLLDLEKAFWLVFVPLLVMAALMDIVWAAGGGQDLKNPSWAGMFDMVVYPLMIAILPTLASAGSYAGLRTLAVRNQLIRLIIAWISGLVAVLIFLLFIV